MQHFYYYYKEDTKIIFTIYHLPDFYGIKFFMLYMALNILYKYDNQKTIIHISILQSYCVCVTGCTDRQSKLTTT